MKIISLILPLKYLFSHTASGVVCLLKVFSPVLVAPFPLDVQASLQPPAPLCRWQILSESYVCSWAINDGYKYTKNAY